jgi:hypothetical protein
MLSETESGPEAGHRLRSGEGSSEAQRIARDLGVSVEGLFAEAERLLEISGL